MSINAFLTNIAPQAGQNVQPGGSKTALSGSTLQIQGLSFFDFFLAQGAQQVENAKTTVPGQPGGIAPQDTPQTGNPFLAQKTKLDIDQALGNAPQFFDAGEGAALGDDALPIDQLTIKGKLKDELADLPALIDLYLGQGDDVTNVQTLQTAEGEPEIVIVPDNAGGDMDTDDVIQNKQQLEAFLKKLEHVLNGPGLSTLRNNLSPEQLTELEEQIQQIKAALEGEIGNAGDVDLGDQENLSSIIASLIQLIDPQNKINGGPNASQKEQVGAKSANDLAIKKQDADLMARLNSLVVGGDEAGTDGETRLDAERTKEKFSDVLGKTTGTKPDSSTVIKGNAVTLHHPDIVKQASLAPSSAFDSQLFTSSATDVTAVPQVTDLNTLTNITTQVQQAGRAHPATQMVAATVQKSLNGGENRNITLQLDPPDLGKVEVRMEFGKDKTVKATVISEKPETYMMLQRDAHSMERLFQNAGLSADSSLSFELAQDGYDFNHNGRHDGQSGHGGQGQSGDDQSGMIETTMTWHVDPNTGHMRYNIFA